MDVVTNRVHSYSFSKGFADGYALLVRQVESNTRRAVIILALAVALIIAVLVFPAPAFSNQGNLPAALPASSCTLACDPSKMTCSRYPSSQVPSMSTRRQSVPQLYQYVPSGTRCDATACVQDPYLCVIGTI